MRSSSRRRAAFPVQRLCRLIGVAASAFYAWLRRGPTTRSQDEVALVSEIRDVFEQSGETYGSPRIVAPSPCQVIVSLYLKCQPMM